ncbi:MAG: nucleotidyltransferase domain-containing protein [archaeon]
MYLKRNKELRILKLYLGDYNKQFYLREIHTLTKIPLKTTQTAIKNLEKANIIKSKIRGKNKYFKLNLDNINTKYYLIQAEIQKTFSFIEKYPLIKTFLKEIENNSPFIVFGSFAKLQANKYSDMDLMVISEKKLPFHLLPYKIHKQKITERTFQKALMQKETLIEEIKENHIILNNHSFFVNLMWKYYHE